MNSIVLSILPEDFFIDISYRLYITIKYNNCSDNKSEICYNLSIKVELK